MTIDPTTNGPNGRDPLTGKFSPGNPGGPGNPYVRKVASLRAALMDAVTEDDIRDVLAALVREAKSGNVQAMKEFFNRVLGQAEAIDLVERLAELESVLERTTR